MRYVGEQHKRRHQVRLTLAIRLALMALLSTSVSAQKWERLGPEGGMVQSLGTGPGKQIYLGTTDGHVFFSNDGAHTWELCGRVGWRLDGVVTRIFGDPRDENRVFAAVWYQQPGAGGGVFESEDQGHSWKLIGLANEAVRALEISSSNPNELVAGTRTGVFLSADQGKSWQRISPEGDQELKNVDSVAIDPRDPRLIYVGTYHLPWLTRDSGKSWKPVITGIIDDSDIMSLRVDSTNPDRVYMSACSGIYRSENQGSEWIKLQGIPYAARRTQVIVQDPAKPRTLYAGTTAGLWVTRDGGESWTRTTSREWVVNSVAVLGSMSGAAERVVLGTEGQGIQVSDDSGITFVTANHGFTHVIVKELVADPRHPGRVLAILERERSEILESRDDGRSWSNVSLTALEHGKKAAINPAEVQQSLASPWGWMLRMDNGKIWRYRQNSGVWSEWKLLLGSPTQHGVTNTRSRSSGTQLQRPLTPETAIAFSEQDAVVATRDGVMRCNEGGSCFKLKAYGPSAQVRSVWLSASGRDIAVIMNGKIGYSSDSGESAVWQDLPVSEEQVVWLDHDDGGANATTYLGTTRGIFVAQQSVLNGEWESVEGGLPGGQIDQWSRVPGAFIVTERDGGVYMSADNGASWTRVDQDAERGIFTGLAVVDGAVLAGSQSEGLLRLNWVAKLTETGQR